MSTEILSERYSEFVLAHTAPTTSKVFLLIGAMVVMAMSTALANVSNVFVYRTNCIRVPKATGVWAPGVLIYWDNTVKKFTTTSTANTLAGYVAESALSGDTEGIIDLDPSA